MFLFTLIIFFCLCNAKLPTPIPINVLEKAKQMICELCKDYAGALPSFQRIEGAPDMCFNVQDQIHNQHMELDLIRAFEYYEMYLRKLGIVTAYTNPRNNKHTHVNRFCTESFKAKLIYKKALQCEQ